MSKQKQNVKQFYDTFGWKKTATGLYEDAEAFKDNRTVFNIYHKRNNKKLETSLKTDGTFLEVGCGANPHPHLTTKTHVCLDISKTGLQEARKKLGNKATYILADITQLPFKKNVFSSTLAAHVIYHIPASLQTKAIQELHRTLKPQHNIVIIYSQSRIYLTKILITLGHKIKTLLNKTSTQTKNNIPPLYYYAHDIEHFKKTLPKNIKLKTRCWSLIDKNFTKAFVPNNMLGKTMLAIIMAVEKLFPHFSTRFCSFQMITIKK